MLDPVVLLCLDTDLIDLWMLMKMSMPNDTTASGILTCMLRQVRCRPLLNTGSVAVWKDGGANATVLTESGCLAHEMWFVTVLFSMPAGSMAYPGCLLEVLVSCDGWWRGPGGCDKGGIAPKPFAL